LRPREAVKHVAVPDGGQSYNPALDDWEDLIHRKATKEQERLDKLAQVEWVPQPETIQDEPELSESEDEQPSGPSYLAKPVKALRKTQTQRNKQARQVEQVHPPSN
jgi:hypothetical protein